MTSNEFLNAFGGVKATYKPDILTCLANLSNDEVFTPPNITNDILDLLPQELFENSETKFLDPACKSGVFLREIARRLMKGLEKKIPNEQDRRNHIFTKQVFGIAITSLTAQMTRRSAYCSKTANGKYSVCSAFKTESGNVKFEPMLHTFKNGNCIYCGASEKEYGEKVRDKLESHAYEFIHMTEQQIKEMKEMKFDVIIGNPPYQLNTGGTKSQATPLYNLFVQQAKKLNPRYLTMIVPSRWYAGGMGLDNFRETMLNDDHIRVMVDYSNAKDCFPGTSIGGGVNYFLWDRDNKGLCNFTNIHFDTRDTAVRKLNEFPVFIRHNQGLNIVHKVMSKKEPTLASMASSLSPFGIGSAERGNVGKNSKSLTLYSSGGMGYLPDDLVTSGRDLINKYKVMISKVTSEHAGEPDKDGKFRVLSTMKVLKPKEICTFSYFLIGTFDNEKQSNNLFAYLKTSFARFLLMQAVSSINLSKDKFCFVPQQDFNRTWSDKDLYEKYKLTKEEIDFIDGMIRPWDNNLSNKGVIDE